MIDEIATFCELVDHLEKVYGVVVVNVCLGTQRDAVQCDAHCSRPLLALHFKFVAVFSFVAMSIAMRAVAFRLEACEIFSLR